jgi:hypothetical protein
MKTTTKTTISALLKVKANVQRGTRLRVQTGIRAAGIDLRNHNRTGLRVKAGIKAGSMITVRNHNARLLTL